MSTPSGPQAPCQDRDETTLETAFQILGGIQEQIRFADSKAGVLITLLAILFGFTASNISDVKTLVSGSGVGFLFYLPVILYVLSSVAAVILSIMVVRSRFGGNAPQSKVFFGHIIRKYGWDYERYAADMKSTTAPEWIRELGTQILEVSHIASSKHTVFRWASDIAMAAVILWLIVLAQVLWLAASNT